MPRVQKRQCYNESCGAACLLCAAIELGVTNLPDFVTGPLPLCLDVFNSADLHAHGWDGSPIQPNNRCEEAIYYVTSGGTSAGYSMPSGICRAALALNLSVTAYLGKSLRRLFILPRLKRAYPDEIENVRGLGVAVHKSGLMYLKDRQRALSVLVRTDPLNRGALHYVMRRPGGSFMDPDTGADHSWWTFFHHRDPVTRAKIQTTYTGISLALSR